MADRADGLAGIPRRPAGLRPARFVHAGRLPGAVEAASARFSAIGLGSSDFTAEELAGPAGAALRARGRGAARRPITGSRGRSAWAAWSSRPTSFSSRCPTASSTSEPKIGITSPADRDIPIIIPRNYLNLYNYGFARSQGLPQISEGIFRRVLTRHRDCRVTDIAEQFRGRIVGLSNRLNTILVPDAFIRWSNGRFGSRTSEKRPARVIVETDRPVDAAVSEYLARKGYEAEGDRRDDGKATRFLRLAAGGVAGVGTGIQRDVVLRPDAEHLPAVAEEQRQDRKPASAGLRPDARGAALPAADARAESGAVLCVPLLLAVWLLRLCLPAVAGGVAGGVSAGGHWGSRCCAASRLALLLSLLNGPGDPPQDRRPESGEAAEARQSGRFVRKRAAAEPAEFGIFRGAIPLRMPGDLRKMTIFVL